MQSKLLYSLLVLLVFHLEMNIKRLPKIDRRLLETRKNRPFDHVTALNAGSKVASVVQILLDLMEF